MSRRTRTLTLIGVGLAAATATVLSLTPTRTRTTATGLATSSRGSGIGLYELGGGLAYVTEPNQYSMVVADLWDNLSTSNAKRRGLAYFDPLVVKPGGHSTGVTYTEAVNKDWLLKCGTGYCINSVYDTYGVDIGNTAYQRAWIATATKFLTHHPGVKGIFNDSVIHDPKATFGTYPDKYPDTGSWDTAMISFLRSVYTALHAKGYYVAVNAGAYKPGDPTYNDGTAAINWWKQVAPYTDAMMNEYYAEASGGSYLDQPRSSGTAWYQHWDGWQRLIGLAQSLGKAFIGTMYGGCTNTAQMTYGKASFLLEWNGGKSVFAYNGGRTCDPTNGAWTTNIGWPTSPKVRVGAGWQRAYTGGTVLVNPSPSSSQTFTVNDTHYTLDPTTARILVR